MKTNNTSDPLAALRGKFNIQEVGAEWHIRCRQCTTAWALRLSSRVHVVNILRLLNHHAKHQQPAISLPQSVHRVRETKRGYIHHDGGRADAGHEGTTGDCVCRAISIASGLPYQRVYDLLNAAACSERITKRRRTRSNARRGVHKDTIKRVLLALGWEWHPTMFVGQGCKVHLRASELPKGRLIVAVSKHLVAVVDGVIHDNHDPSRNGKRCVYGYWTKPD
jgi:hypothetical protein